MRSGRTAGSAPPVVREDFREALICGLLIAAVFAVYWPVRHFDFINLDDDAYVTANPIVQAGLSWSSVKWAFTTTAVVNWHPLTWLSHLLDCTLFDLHAGAHHVVSVLLHAAASVLLFVALKSATGAFWRSALVAALFAVHPLHVESVAWVAERKDVLSGVCWMLALLAYGHYVKRPGLWRHLVVTMAFALGLMAKPMVVTLPCVLLLLDYWPFGRFEANAVFGKQSARLFLEKLPWFALSAASGLITAIIQRQGGAMRASEIFGLPTRLANALVSYAQYIGKTIYPHALIVPYPHPGASLPLWDIAGAAAILVGISGMAIVLVRRRPYLFVGWFWFLGTLVPVIGIIQVGNQAMADRYTYLPLTGLFIIVAWGAADLAGKRARGGQAAGLALTVMTMVLAVCAGLQVQYWRNSITLFEHTLRSSPANTIAHNNLGTALMEQGRYEEAAAHFSRALEVAPGNLDALSNLGVTTLLAGKPAEAAAVFVQVLRFTPNDPTVYNNLGVAYLNMGEPEQARQALLRALDIDPHCEKARQVLQMLPPVP